MTRLVSRSSSLLRSAVLVLSVSLSLGVSACRKAEGAGGQGGARVLKVGVNPVPHGEVLRAAIPVAEREGVRIEVVEFTDYVQPNLALSDGQLDANYYQHVPYMERFSKDRGLAFASVGAVHLEPLALYSTKHATLAELPEGARITIPADPTNAGRALHLLAKNGLLKLKDGVGVGATVKDVTDNPRRLELREIDAEQQPRALEDVAAAVINGNYYLEAAKHLKLDAKVLAREAAEGNPYANVLAVRKGDEARPEVQVLLRALQSAEVRRFIESSYGGAVVPAK
jgi:D-methionine transport system substrate-binding protein